MGEYYIGQYRDHYAIFDSMGRVQTQYDTHAEAKADLDSYNKTGKPLPEAASKDSVIDKAFKGHVNSMFDTTSKEFKKVGNDVGNDKKAKQTWWNDMKLTARMHKKPYPKVNGYTNGDFKPNHEWLMAAIDQCRSVTDCECLIKDGYLAISQDKQLVKNLRAVKEGNPSRYVNVKLIQKRLDNGVTPEKVEKHIEWMKENYIKGLQAKKKEFKKSQNESTNNESMNEGPGANIAFGIFCLITMAPVIAAKVMEAKDKRRLKTGKGAHKVSYEEFSTMYNSTRKLIQDVQRLQKSSKYYKIIYKYNTVKEEIVAGNKSSNILAAFKKGSPVELCGTCVYYEYDCIEEYKDLLKSLPEPDKKYYESDKNEDYINNIEYAIQDEFNDHFDKLGFANGKDDKCRSSKYPGIYISYTISGDGTWFHIYPDCPGTIVVIDNNKLNEDYSEISNDPEMEKLLALAGYTIEDLDTINNEEDIELDDDDPIDANTSREIDAVMDESSKTVETEEDIKFLLKDINKKIEGLDKLVIECANVIEWTKSHVIKDLDKSQKAKDEYSKQVNIFKNKMQKIIAKYVDVNDPDDIKQYKRFFDLMRSPFKGFVLNSKKLNDIEKEAAKELDDSGATYKNFVKAKERIMSVTSSIVDYTKQFKSDDNIPHDSTSYLYQWVVNVFDAVIFPLRDDIIRTAAIVQASCGNAKTGHFRLNKIKDTVNESAYNGYFMCSDFDKKSQNESVDDFDYLMESIFMDIDH